MKTAACLAGLFVLLSPGSSSRVWSAAPRQLTQQALWLQPGGSSVPLLGGAAEALAAGNPKAALPVFARAVTDPVVGGYARLYKGRAELALNELDAAEASARGVISTSPAGALGEAARWLLADVLEQSGRWSNAAEVLRELTTVASSNLASAHLRYGRASYKSEAPSETAQAYARVYFEYPLSDEAAEAESELKRLFHWPPASQTLERAERRAEVLYAARRYADARKAYETVSTLASAVDRPRIDLRLAECDFFLKRYAAARDQLRTYLDTTTTRLDEAAYFHLSAVRLLNRESEYLALVRSFVAAQPQSPFAETALNDLATYYILANDDERAVEVFREMLRVFPRGAYTDRAAWKAGWWAFRNGDYDEAVRIFDTAQVEFPRADYRPSWLYWSARANERLGRLELALTGYERTIASYRNSYYGRQATRAAATIGPKVVRPAAFTPATGGSQPSSLSISSGAPPPTTPLIRALLSAALYDDAIIELRAAQREAGTSPLIEATIAYALNRKGELRPAITTMRRAYPQFMAKGGEALPNEILKVIFPLEHWDLIRREAAGRNLDPYLMAALVAQESTFQADVRSSANAWGLMQIIPATGRRYATRLGIRRFTTARLTDPDVNVRIGMAVFGDLMKQFGDAATALAAYNAGENRAARWRAERPGVERDEFIDDIPFPETQNYVKRILGTAEDYRLLYGGSRQASAAGGVRESRR